MSESHQRFTDKAVYDVILTQILEVFQILLQISPREVAHEFVNQEELALQLGLHAYYAPCDAVRL
jgi:hypothetical protein